MAKSKSVDEVKSELLKYYKEPNTELALDHLHELKNYFFCIIDELETLSREVKTLNDCIAFQGALLIIEDYFLKMCILNFPSQYKGTYFSIIENISKSLQITENLIEECLELELGICLKKLVEIQNPVELALDFTIELIVELENATKEKTA
jgi:hypothetical protein